MKVSGSDTGLRGNGLVDNAPVRKCVIAVGYACVWPGGVASQSVNGCFSCHDVLSSINFQYFNSLHGFPVRAALKLTQSFLSTYVPSFSPLRGASAEHLLIQNILTYFYLPVLHHDPYLLFVFCTYNKV